MDSQYNGNRTTVTVIQLDINTDKLISDEALLFYQWICHSIVSQAFSVFGTASNIVNMICFIKQGFKDPVNVTLFGLVISDLGCLVTMLWFNVCMTPAFQVIDLPFNIVDMIYLGAGWPHCIFARVTSFLTAFITLERCLCIAMPLAVRRIFTPKRATIIVAFLFTILIVSVFPIYFVNRFAMVFVPSRNKTVWGIVLTEDRMDVLTVAVVINNVVIPFGAFAVVIVCTTLLVVNLHRKTKWRKIAAVGNADSLLSRDQKVSKMILIISTVFIICFFPSCVNCVAITIEPRIGMYGQYRNTFIVLFGLCFALESANSSVNIFVYYSMSSKFRETFRKLFRLHLSVH